MHKVKEVVVMSNEKSPDWVEYSSIAIEKYHGMEGEKFLSHSFLLDCFRKLMGRTLTVIDASITEKAQNKAMKDIVKGIFSDEMEFVGGMAYDQKIMEVMAEEHFKNVDPKDIQTLDVEEVLGVTPENVNKKWHGNTA